jgi:hypothetical protein
MTPLVRTVHPCLRVGCQTTATLATSPSSITRRSQWRPSIRQQHHLIWPMVISMGRPEGDTGRLTILPPRCCRGCHKVHVDQSHTTKGGATSSIKKIEVHDRAFGWEASVGAANRQLQWVHDQGIHRLLHWWRYMKSHLRSLHATLEWSCAAPDQTVLATAPTLTKEREMSSC